MMVTWRVGLAVLALAGPTFLPAPVEAADRAPAYIVVSKSGQDVARRGYDRYCRTGWWLNVRYGNHRPLWGTRCRMAKARN